MIKPYLVTYKFYYNNELLSCRTRTHLLETPLAEEYSGTDFEDLWDLTYKWAAVMPLSMWEFKKGKRFLENDKAGWFGRKITPKNCKPWKLVISSEKTVISMRGLMNFNTELVIQYLKERGITTCPILK